MIDSTLAVEKDNDLRTGDGLTDTKEPALGGIVGAPGEHSNINTVIEGASEAPHTLAARKETPLSRFPQQEHGDVMQAVQEAGLTLSPMQEMIVAGADIFNSRLDRGGTPQANLQNAKNASLFGLAVMGALLTTDANSAKQIFEDAGFGKASASADGILNEAGAPSLQSLPVSKVAPNLSTPVTAALGDSAS